MKCLNCNKVFVQPLELFTGSFACPKCKSTLFDVSSKIDFEITKINEEQYRQSEILYHMALTTNVKADYNKYLKEALDLCKASANTYNPKAMVRLAYYYDYDYIDKNRSELDRCKIAKSFYRAICFGEFSNLKIDEGIPSPNIKEIKENAAILYFNMLEGLDEETKESLGVKQIDADKLKLAKQYQSVIHNYDLENVALFDHNAAASILDIIKNTVQKVNPPIFGSFKVSIHEARELFTMNNNEILKYLRKGCSIYVVDDVNGLMDPDSRFVKLNMLSIINAEIMNKNRGDVYLVFVNNGVKLSLRESLAFKSVFKQIVNDNFDIIRVFETDINGSSFAFNKDDLCWKNYKVQELLDEAKSYL